MSVHAVPDPRPPRCPWREPLPFFFGVGWSVVTFVAGALLPFVLLGALAALIFSG